MSKIALSAYAGAIGLVTGWLKLDDLTVARLPLGSPVLGAFVLVLIVAVPTSWLAWLAWHGDSRTEPVELLTGILLVGWILVELAFIRVFSSFHPLYLLFGIILIWLGRHGAQVLRDRADRL